MFRKLKHWIAIAAASLGIYQVQRAPTIEVKPTSVVVATPTPLPMPTPKFQAQFPHVSLGEVRGRQEEIEMAKEAVNLVNTVLADDCFKKTLLASKLTETNGLSNQGIYDLLVKNPQVVNIEFYDGSWKENYVYKTIGWEADPFDGWMHSNRHFVYSAYSAANNVIHEVEGHSQRFRHDGNKSTSVPYFMNNTFDLCAPHLGIKDE